MRSYSSLNFLGRLVAIGLGFIACVSHAGSWYPLDPSQGLTIERVQVYNDTGGVVVLVKFVEIPFPPPACSYAYSLKSFGGQVPGSSLHQQEMLQQLTAADAQKRQVRIYTSGDCSSVLGGDLSGVDILPVL